MKITKHELASLERKHVNRSLYWSNRPHILAALSERNLDRKVSGQCRRCPRAAQSDHGMCRRCAAKDRASARLRMKRLRVRRRREERREIAAYRPIDEVTDLNRVRILRAAKMLDWFSGAELNEILGAVDRDQRNTTTQMLSRLTRAGRFERREVASVHDVIGSPFEYRITAAGLSELEQTLGTGRRFSSRRAA